MRSFFVRLAVFSDDLSAGYDEIVSVDPLGEDVRVRVIRISLADRNCPGQLLRAAERVLPRTTVERVAKANLCAFTEKRVEKSLAAAKPRTEAVIFEAVSQSIVATCGTTERALSFPWEQNVDRKALRRTDPEVNRLWNVAHRVRRLVVDRPLSSYDQTALEALGTSVVPELISGKFEAGFRGFPCGDGQKQAKCDPNYLARRLKGYAGAPAQRGPLPVELIDSPSIGLIKYVAPRFPEIALSARVFGDVQLRVTADPQTGDVRDVAVMAGSPLLTASAVEAARAWQFAPASVPRTPLTVTLRFQLRCPQN